MCRKGKVEWKKALVWCIKTTLVYCNGKVLRGRVRCYKVLVWLHIAAYRDKPYCKGTISWCFVGFGFGIILLRPIEYCVALVMRDHVSNRELRFGNGEASSYVNLYCPTMV